MDDPSHPPRVVRSLFTWVPVGAGRLALSHRPGARLVPHLAATGCDVVVTLLAEHEGAGEIGRAVEAAGLRWVWLPLRSGRPPAGKNENARVLETLPALSRLLDEGRSLLIHCSAGMHRTGMVGYVLLRWRGLAASAVLEHMERMRPHARRILVAPHLAWGDGLVAGGERR